MQGACKERNTERTASAELLEMFGWVMGVRPWPHSEGFLGTGVATAMGVLRSLGEGEGAETRYQSI